MMNLLATLDTRLAPVEDLFFTWLIRVVIAATLVGTAEIDDAPPLEGAAMAVGLYVLFRVATQFGAFSAVAPFENRVLRGLTAVGALGVLYLSFLVILVLTSWLAVTVAG